ncbi:kinesin-like protein KIN-12F, partial [Cornus florida]|uniref:kinesin-like protein KIN-12F n=1 Tax=Cornus florida TaxID=4283 RepID=UPI0028962EB8
MLRDFKFLRRNSGKNSNAEEIENVPINPRYSLGNQTGTDSNRAPLNAIQEPASNSKAVVEKEVGVRSTKVDKTPTKVKRKSSDNTMSLSTPEKQGAQAKSRFGWVPKNESSSNAIESHDDGRADMSHYMSQSSRVNGNGVFAGMTTPQSNRVMGRANSGYSECNSTQSTPTKSVTKPPNPGLCLTGGSRPLSNGGARMGNFAALSKGIPISCSSSTVVNSVEVPHFDLKEDPSFWMDHNVQVLIRVRPLNSKEKSTNAYSRCLKQESAQCITWIGQPETRFTFDHVACETIDQETLFRMVGLPMVENCLSGYNSCVFAYGQTGSGKTYTMLGEIEELEVKPSPNRGMTPRIFEFLFARIRAEEESRRDERLKYNCKCSFLEIYNEQITDLLDPSSTNLLLREDIKTGVYVENLSEFEVQTVGDILKLLSQGSSNRKVAATNMNRESSRSHSVFTCVIERRWEKDSTSNLRFARLNLVDLAGSERQKTSGAEGERLKEAANINKSLSTLGHVIMVLLDVAHGRTKHVPYRDSRLTFLLQDSLGGNSKTMMIANVSPSIWCAAETLNTLKFAQRAKLIQNNAVVNEDSSGDVIALQHQIQVLTEELSALKRQNVSRSLSFGENPSSQKALELDEQRTDNLLGSESKGILKVSLKQLKSLETTLAGALRREQMAETSIKQLEAELEQLNRLVRQREEDTRCTKMMLKFREDKIQRMESLVSGLIPADAYLLEENGALSEEIQLLRAKLDRNPEVTRFALENIRLLEQIRRYQDFYEEGERELLLTEVSELRDQVLLLALLLDGKSNQNNHPKISATPQEAIHFNKENEMLNLEFKSTLKELEECRSNLNSCLENNEKLSREIDDLRASLINLKTETCDDDSSVEVIKESIIEAPLFDNRSLVAVEKQKGEAKHETLMKHSEEVINLQLELDILKIILKEERSSRGDAEQMRTRYLDRDLELTKEKVLLLTKQCEDVKEELKEAKSVIEALESQQVLSINETEDLRNSNSHYVELLSKQELEISAMKEQMCFQELKDLPSFKHSENEDSPLQAKLKKMQGSLEKAKRLNMWYQSDRTFQTSNEEEMDEVRKQVEAETAEVIVCLQEELAALQQQVQDSKLKERETQERLVLLQNELKELHEKLYLMAQDKKELGERLEEKDDELKLKELLQTDLKEELQEKLYLMALDKKELGEELQEELATLQQQVQDSKLKERETQERLVLFQTELKELQEKFSLMAQDKKELGEKLEEKDDELKALSEEWEQLTCEIEYVLTGGSEALKDASNQLDVISGSFPQKRACISEKVGRVTKIISEKELLIEELNQCLDDANNRRSNMECMLRSLRGAALVITEAHQQECSEKEQEILQLTSQLKAKASLVAELEDKIKEEEEEIRKASTCATVAFLIVNRMSEINSDYHDALKHKDIQLRESIGMNLQKDAFLHNQATVIDEAETQIQSLKTELEVSEESLGKLKLQLLEEQKRACAMEQKLQEIEENDILKTREKLTELKSGVSTLRSCMDEYVEQVGSSENDNTSVNLACLPANGKCGARTGAEMNQGSNKIDSQTVEDLKTEISECTFEVRKNVSEYSLDHKNFAISGTNKDKNDRDATIILLRKEIESAVECLQGVQSEMAKLRNEKEEVWMSAKQSQGSIEYLMTQILTLQTDMSSFEKQLVPKMVAIDHKLQKVGETVQEAGTCWCQKEELFELELGDAKVVAAQKTAEASCILSQFEEAQDTMKEADIMINELVISNETLKLEIEGLKKMEDSIINEKNILINEVQSLQSAKDLQDSHYKNLEDQFASDMMEMRRLVLELESIVGQVQTTFKEDSLSIASDFICMKSQLQDSTMLMRSWLEDIWSEIIVKDCAVSVLHLCHMGILLETVTGLNAENGLLHHGLCESASVISELREHNFKSRNELEMCRILKGKLLADIKNSFDRIARKEDETGELSIKLTTFEKKILNLQLQEELMLQRANNMGSELSVLTKELDMSNRNVLGPILNQEKLLKDKEEVLKSQEENFMIDLSAKDFELLILASELNQVEVQKASMEEEQTSCCMVLENFKKEIIFLTMDAEIERWIMMDEEVEVVILQKEVQEAQRERQELLSKLNESNSRITHMDKVNKTLEQDIQLLKDVSCSNDHLQSELGEVIEEKMRLSSQVKKLEADCEKLIEEIKTKERALEISSSHISDLDLQKQMLHNDKCLLEASSCKLQAELEMKDAELSKMNYLEEENESIKSEVKKLKEDYFRVFQDLEEKKSECESSLSHIDVFDMENRRLQEKISSLETCTGSLQAHLDMVNAELTELRLSQSVITEELCLKGQNLQIHVDRVNTLKQENVLLRNELQSHEKSKYEFFNSLSFNAVKGIDSVEAVEMVGTRIINVLNEKSVPLEKMVEEICKSIDGTSKF